MQDTNQLPEVKCGSPKCDKMVKVRSVRPPHNIGFCNRVCQGEARRAGKFKGMNASTFNQT